jgi:hypothetical protein
MSLRMKTKAKSTTGLLKTPMAPRKRPQKHQKPRLLRKRKKMIKKSSFRASLTRCQIPRGETFKKRRCSLPIRSLNKRKMMKKQMWTSSKETGSKLTNMLNS